MEPQLYPQVTFDPGSLKCSKFSIVRSAIPRFPVGRAVALDLTDEEANLEDVVDDSILDEALSVLLELDEEGIDEDVPADESFDEELEFLIEVEEDNICTLDAFDEDVDVDCPVTEELAILDCVAERLGTFVELVIRCVDE